MIDRTKFIGGTDCAAILGLSRRKTILQLWGEKTGQLEKENISEKLAVKLGIRLEEVVAELFTEATGKKVRRVNNTIFHPDYDFIGANLDRLIVGEEAILECKTTNSYKMKEWEEEEIPIEYILQCLHYLAVTGKEKAYIACIIGNEKFIWKEINRDEEMIKKIILKEVDFWRNFIEPKIMPTMVSNQDTKTLNNLFNVNNDPEQFIVLDNLIEPKIKNIQKLKGEAFALENEIETLENEIKIMMAENQKACTANYEITWKEQTRKNFDKKTFEKDNKELCEKYTKELKTRVFKIKQIKGE